MSGFDAHKNFAYSTVASGAVIGSSSGTSLTVAAGEGAKFPVATFNLSVWPAGVIPSTTNAEIMRVTAVATDTFTVTRNAEPGGSALASIAAGYQVSATISAKTLTDAENGQNPPYGWPSEILNKNPQLNINHRGTVAGNVTDGMLLMDCVRAQVATGQGPDTFDPNDTTHNLAGTANCLRYTKVGTGKSAAMVKLGRSNVSQNVPMSILLAVRTAASGFRFAFFDNTTAGTTLGAGTGGTGLPILPDKDQGGSVHTFATNITSPSSGQFHSGGGGWEFFKLENFSTPNTAASYLEWWFEAAGDYYLSYAYLVNGPWAPPTTYIPSFDGLQSIVADNTRMYGTVAHCEWEGDVFSDAQISGLAYIQTPTFQGTPVWGDELPNSPGTGDTGNYGSLIQGTIGNGGPNGNSVEFSFKPNAPNYPAHVKVNRYFFIVSNAT